MKTFTPKKYSKCQEFENMELEYENRDLRFDCCRIRSNLCELPTTYISNNCQIFSNPSNLTKVSSGNADCFEKPPKSYENPTKVVDFNNTGQNLFIMNDKPVKNVIKNGTAVNSYDSHHKTSAKDHGPEPLPPRGDLWTVPKVYSINGSILSNPKYGRNDSVPRFQYTNRGESFQYDNKKRDSPRSTNRIKPAIVDLKYDSVPVGDTCTFFNKRVDHDVGDLHERYFKEVQALRAKLQEIKTKKMQHALKSENDQKEIIEIKSEETHDKVKIVAPYKLIERQRISQGSSVGALDEGKSCTPGETVETKVQNKRVKCLKGDNRPKISVKARSKRNSIKMRHIRNSKVTSSVSSASDGSERWVSLYFALILMQIII